MNNEEHIFDYMAAAEETGRQLDLMMRQVPGHVKTALADEWRRLPIHAELPETARKLSEAIEEARETAKLLRQTAWAVFAAGVFAAFALPLATWLAMR